ncbi:cupin domain-containing protein [Paraburkholderia sp. MM5384-R2]|uniref:cupin domain-containing protein n=1 Tax=Paraburkholderia sp. MM5384-R2 TaxID=2723097 RepID=UPI00182500FB|nr:cupin domain-containing protein [Paraburkholderia sp. MM5384-R2]MBB5499344.1 mannose-6-phosphate isomerase-like protein (cupin superfamily) [Paraburkholderia sp. MM5384-R2]
MNPVTSKPDHADVSADDAIEGVQGFLVPMNCTDLPATMHFFIARLGFRLDAIFPADSPRTAILSRDGFKLKLGLDVSDGVKTLHVLCNDPAQLPGDARELIAPNGVTVRIVHANPPMTLPATRQQLVLAHAGGDAHWSVGRAGMRYRDLLPERHGGAFIASHIRILDGGPVPDYVHYHKIRFQTIFCRKGWVRLVYEDQGEPFILRAGDCVLQPPEIRHRVLESSGGAEVVELGSPAEHITMADHELSLPTTSFRPERDFNGQRFVRHVAKNASWKPWTSPGFVVTDTGIGAATDGLAGVRVVRAEGNGHEAARRHDTEFCFFFVLSGSLDVVQGDKRRQLKADDSISIPGRLPYSFAQCSADLELLEVTLPADFSLA